MIKKYIYATITAIILNSCMTKSITFIDIEKEVDPIIRNQVVKDSSFLRNGIYLNTNYYNELISLYSIKYRKEVFNIGEKDKKKVFLSNNYKDVKEIIKPIDMKLVEYFQNSFGIENPDEHIYNKSIVYKNRIFVEFVTDLGVNAFVLELIESNVVVVETAYILVD